MSREPESAGGDETRRRIQRDVHHRAQQELVNAVLSLKLARHALADATGPAVELLDEAIAHTVDVSRELHELSDGILPAETLTNTTHHARAESARVVALIDGDLLRLEVHDDGVGGASASRGKGLLGLRDRAAALGGDLVVESPRGGGTLVSATLPIAAAPVA